MALWSYILVRTKRHKNFLKNRQQGIVLNGQFSPWTKVNAGVPQRSILGFLLFLIYINDLANVLQSNPKTLVDDTSLFSTVQDITRKTVRLSMIFEKSLNGQYNEKWNLILVLANKFMGYYLAEKKAPSHICHFI